MSFFSMRAALWTLVPSAAVLALLVFASLSFKIDMALMTRDVASIAGIHPLTGVLSNFGILLWCAATSVCLFSARIVRHSGPVENYRFLLASGLLSAYLLLDDFFLIHETLAPKYLGLRERLVKVLLAAAVAAYLLSYRKVILRTDFGLFVMAIAFLVLSLVVDQIHPATFAALGDWDWQHLLEDGFKWLGISCWCGYFLDTAYKMVLVQSKARRF